MTLGSGKLWYRVRGPVRAYAAVEFAPDRLWSAARETLLEWKAKPNDARSDGWQWIGHDLSDYAGHRVHVEFSPVGGEDLSIARVVDSPEQPPFDLNAHDCPRPSVSGTGGRTLVATVCQQAFLQVVRRLADRQAGGPASSPTKRCWPIGCSSDWTLWPRSAAAAGRAACAREVGGVDCRVSCRRGGVGRPDSQSLASGTGHAGGQRRRRAAADSRQLAHARASGAAPAAGSIGRQRDFSPAPGAAGWNWPALVAADNPLVARVMVNRVWHHLFGAGIVPSVDNFGVLGQPPSSSGVARLSGRAVSREGWSLKRLIRELVLSRTYQMSS